jgi:phospholipid-translocating ATPase
MLTVLIDDKTLMALPELYRFGREGEWFNYAVFTLYMLEGVYQVG